MLTRFDDIVAAEPHRLITLAAVADDDRRVAKLSDLINGARGARAPRADLFGATARVTVDRLLGDLIDEATPALIEERFIAAIADPIIIGVPLLRVISELAVVDGVVYPVIVVVVITDIPIAVTGRETRTPLILPVVVHLARVDIIRAVIDRGLFGSIGNPVAITVREDIDEASAPPADGAQGAVAICGTDGLDADRLLNGADLAVDAVAVALAGAPTQPPAKTGCFLNADALFANLTRETVARQYTASCFADRLFCTARAEEQK